MRNFFKEEPIRNPFTRAEIDLLWENIDQPLVDSVLIMIYTGCRVGELLDIKIEHIHLEERWIDLHGTKTKSAKRIVPIHKKIIPLLEKRMTGTYLFETNNKKITSHMYLENFFKRMCQAFNMNHKAQDCRHSFEAYAAASKLDKTLVKRIMGQSTIDLTAVSVEDLIKEIDKLEL